MPESPLFDLRCARCGEPYPPSGLPAECPACGGFWRIGDAFAWQAPSADRGLRRWAPALGLAAAELPEREVARPAAQWRERGEPGLWLSQQGSAPTGSYKERGAEVLASAALRRGVGELFLDSSGNAGIAMAMACAARGIRATVLVPEATPAEKVERIRGAGGAVEIVHGDREAAHRAAQERRLSVPYAVPFLQPAFQMGMATLAWELAGELPRLPAHWLLPAGNGQILMGLALGFDRLGAARPLARRPVLHAVQLAGYAALSPTGPGTPLPGPPTAAGIAIARPPRRDDMAACLAHAGGDVTVVSEEEIAAARVELAAAGWPTDPTGAAAFAAWRRRPDLQTAAAEGDCLAILSSRAERSNEVESDLNAGVSSR